ncbi:glucuronate isomerase [Arenibacter palladensis]|uniref:glucuronate isomerase n=1 Tax=Arenibacter palladensis TaxID=237373 RepID=UPI0026E1E198|nr:glucuronate isomerase [Arenibacter palladensis]MDO6605686.1 glucuronate isomerase [Arenibacter palladensis]
MKEITSLISVNFLLQNPLAISLYHEFAAVLPIVDYHNHIDETHLAANHSFQDLYDVWVNTDPYKHRAMRINGIPEKFITGPGSNKVKFLRWSKTMPMTVGNPLYHWSIMELNHVFGINYALNENNAESIWEECNSKLKKEEYTAISLLKKWNVETLCTSDDWLNDLTVHAKASTRSGTHVLPSLRADKILNFNGSNYREYLERLGNAERQKIESLNELKSIILLRLSYFNKYGCKLSDHTLDSGFSYHLPTDNEAHNLFSKSLNGELLATKDVYSLQSYLLSFLGKEYSKLEWVMQLHIGAQRHTSSRLRKMAGASGGYASIGKACDINSLCNYLDDLEKDGHLPDIILYTLNPSDNEAFASLTGSYSEDGKPGKVQFGPAWWYNDHLGGIEKHLKTIAEYSLLSRFIGMTTDSRSLLSFSRHDYFRRILCNLIGEWVLKGVLPNDRIILKQLIINICYKNSKNALSHG